jgi:hypothetical protein
MYRLRFRGNVPVTPFALSGSVATKFGELVDDLYERLRGIDLVSAGPTYTWLHLGQVAEHELPLRWGLPIRIGRARLDATEENVRRSTQEDNRIEALVKAALVGDRAGDI